MKMATATKPDVTKGHRGIVAGSRKEKIAIAFDKRGPDAALKEAEKLEVKATTARSWMSAWRKTNKPTSVAPAKARGRSQQKEGVPA
jgi:predicted ArsR family transcriptional regulator